MKKVNLKPAKEKSLLRKHPWVFSGAIKNVEKDTKDGSIVEIFSNKEKYLATGDTLCDEKKHIVLESMDFPDPVIGLAIEPKTQA